MGGGKQEERSKSSRRTTKNENPNKRKRIPLGPNRVLAKNEKKTKTKPDKNHISLRVATAAEQLTVDALYLDYADKCILELSRGMDQSASNLGEHMKAAFGSSWKEVLCEKQLLEGKIDPGSPALLVISLSALRSLELLRAFRDLTRECYAAKLFSKHMKIEDQVAILKNRVNIACGTPSRIKKLIDVEALGLSRLAVIVLDMHTDVKGYSLFTLPQVRLFLLLPLPFTIVLSYAIEMNSGTCISATSTHG
ncbi:hypothetical protein RHGRI_025826 [Rhododendron griersonianum]|uniref:Protein CMSS1 n=1 Tax=Rhododendron griersonianum TaxID=479676 RepID=A0AAV6IV11_9ERIC|nr:hypothetical protein RHGRI_025826 [Rhododendron griersonianum]